MPFLFARQGAQWNAAQITGARSYLSPAPLGFDPAAAPDAALIRPTLVRIDRASGAGRWVLVVPHGSSLLHNGHPVTSGIRALAHGDSLALDGRAPIFFSTEQRATVERFTGSATLRCPRCRADLVPGEASVRCPGCGVVHHEGPERNCWSYAPTCAVCSHATASDGELTWTPAEL